VTSRAPICHAGGEARNGEFGAVKVVSGNIADQTQTATLLVEAKYQGFDQTAAYAVAAVLAFAAMACLIVVSILRPEEDS